MSTWTSQVVHRFKALLDKDASAPADAADPSDEAAAALRRVAEARTAEMTTVQSVHATLTSLAFSGYEQWCQEPDDDWITNCLGQVLNRDQSTYLVSALEQAVTADLRFALGTMAMTYTQEWVRAAQTEADQTGLKAFPNDASWDYSRTPGTRYYIFRDGEYLYSDHPDAPLAGWLTSAQREDNAAGLAKPWQDSGWWYTPTGLGDPAYVYGKTDYGPWLTEAQAQTRLARVADPAPLKAFPNDAGWNYSRTPGTRYYILRDGEYLYSDHPDAPLTGWLTSAQREDNAAGKAKPWQDSGWWYTPTGLADPAYVYGSTNYGPWLTQEQAQAELARTRASRPDAGQPQPDPAALALFAEFLRRVEARSSEAVLQELTPEQRKQMVLSFLAQRQQVAQASELP